ncbi:MAG: hypothetical protein EA366_05020 [Spirulina sp. DLM2.Bin59]|nr:MAG: hypothetical protein EA366_05020 [Spirulina sp. DLM2.Bin59]
MEALIGLGGVVGLILLVMGGRSLYNTLIARLPPNWQKIYLRLIAPDLPLVFLILIVGVSDVVLIYLPLNYWWWLGETALGLLLGAFLILFGTRFFARLFDRYLLDTAIQSRQKVNSELLNVTKAIANGLLIIIVVIIFAQVHRFNIVGLLASLGVGGLAIAFAAQKTLEQILGGIVIYLDRPFVVDDYIGLPDGIFGRVESIGMRSTKIRTSGKGTLVIVPNSVLASINIENYTSAKKIISLVYLTFDRLIEDTEKAFVRQIILDSTKDILGVDPRSTEVRFKVLDHTEGSLKSQAQINFFILGSGDVSMDLRKQVLEIANQNITRQLTEFGVEFSIEERSLNVDSPITI